MRTTCEKVVCDSCGIEPGDERKRWVSDAHVPIDVGALHAVEQLAPVDICPECWNANVRPLFEIRSGHAIVRAVAKKRRTAELS